MRLLVVTTEPITGSQLREALSGEVRPEEAEVMVVAPALQESPLKFWLSDADEAIARADQVRRRTVAELDDAGVAASGDVGESDPVQAIQDALQTFQADRIVLFEHQGQERQYREQLDGRELEERFGLRVDRAPVTGGSSA
jgi:hypothetical protein